jgi:hypothetical protein
MNIDFIINFICIFLIFFAITTTPLLIYELVNADKENIKKNKIIKILKVIIEITLLFLTAIIIMTFLICNNVLV